MLSSLLILSAAFLAQGQDPVFTNWPADATSFHLISPNGEDLGEVILYVGGEWWTGDKEALPAGYTGVKYRADTPWNSTEPQTLRRGSELTPSPKRFENAV